ncbi:MAG: diguanylate cyclase [Xenococcaceae cyanobacterium MO_188.B32]|nr:diguanylate cyclase [Xenococcaceae cyanobacterium MO_188.B32]
MIEQLDKNVSKLPLRFVLIVPFIIQIIITVGLTGYFSWRNGQKTVESLAMRLSREVTSHIEEHVYQYTHIPSLFLKINQANVKAGNLDLNNLANLERTFWLQTQLTEQITTLYFGNDKGEFVEVDMTEEPKVAIRSEFTAPLWEIYNLNDRGNKIELIKKEEYDPRSRPWYRAAIEQGGLVWSPIYLFADPPVLGITPAIPIYEQQTKKLKGVMAIDLTLIQISDFLRSLKIGPSGRAFIMERSGKIVATSTEEPPVILTKTINQRLNAKNSQDLFVRSAARYLEAKFNGLDRVDDDRQFIAKFNRQRQFIQVTPLNHYSGLDWLMVVAIPEVDFMEYIHANTRTTIILCLTSLISAISLGIFINQWIAHSMFRLSYAARAIASGELDQRVETQKIQELEILAQSFNSMTQRLQALFHNLEKANTDLEQRVAKRTKKLQQANEQLQRLANIDSLTQISNRHCFDSSLERQWRICLREQKPIALILCDVDYFKTYNDFYGHPTGDRCLQQIAQAINKTAKRPNDLVARYGGEEFAVILPNTDLDGAICVAEKIKSEVKKLKIRHVGSHINQYVTISCGVTSQIPTQELSSEWLIALADRALYEAKEQGRDRLIAKADF